MCGAPAYLHRDSAWHKSMAISHSRNLHLIFLTAIFKSSIFIFLGTCFFSSQWSGPLSTSSQRFFWETEFFHLFCTVNANNIRLKAAILSPNLIIFILCKGSIIQQLHGQGFVIFDPLPPRLVHLVIEWPLINLRLLLSSFWGNLQLPMLI